MDSDNDSGNSNDGPIHRRRTQGTRPPPPNVLVQSSSSSSAVGPTTSHSNSMQRMSTNPSTDRTYHPTKEDAPYSDDDDIEEDEEEDDDHQRRHHQQSTYRGRGRPSQQQQHLMDSSYDDNDDHHDLPRYTGPLREQDRFLPIANVAKIMKKGVPEKGKIAKDAKETIQECVSEFISFITSEASDRCLQEKRKTINGEDILLAMLTLGFDSYVEPLRTFLTKVRDASKYDRTITMGGDLSDDIRMQVTQTQVNPTTANISQTQVPTTVQVQTQPTNTNTNLAGQAIAAKVTGTPTNANGLEPYGHSVRVVTCIRNDQPGENPNYVYTIQPYQ